MYVQAKIAMDLFFLSTVFLLFLKRIYPPNKEMIKALIMEKKATLSTKLYITSVVVELTLSSIWNFRDT